MKKILRGDEITIIFAKIGTVIYGIDIKYVVSIIEPQNVRSVPLAPVYINSVMNYQGNIITLFDISIYHKEENGDSHVKKKVIYLKQPDMNIGLIVNEIIQIDYVSASCLEKKSDSDKENRKKDFIKGTFIIDDKSPGVEWLDTDKIKTFLNSLKIK